MRQIHIQVAREHGERALEIARSHGGTNLAQFAVESPGGPHARVIADVPNRRVETLVEALEELPDLHVTLVPRGVMALQPPAAEAPEQVTDVQLRSPIEIFLGGLQSVGSWRGFLGYAATAGVVVWIGLFTGTAYLLTAAMLIAPFAGPAMNTAIATARGDWQLFRRSVVRYVASLATTIAAAAALSLLFQQRVASEQMVERSQVSSAAILLPLAAGVAGALNLVQSERSSLVSGAAVGMLVAASLAPPAGVIGMAAVIGEWEMVANGLFLLVLQLAGINASGTIVFRLAGLTPSGPRYARGKRWLSWTTLGATAALLAGLLTWQFWTTPDLQRSSRAQRAAADVRTIVNESGLARTVEANARFTRADIPGQDTLLVVVYVLRGEGVALAAEEVRGRLTAAIARQLEARFDVTPLVDVRVLDPPAPR